MTTIAYDIFSDQTMSNAEALEKINKEAVKCVSKNDGRKIHYLFKDGSEIIYMSAGLKRDNKEYKHETWVDGWEWFFTYTDF